MPKTSVWRYITLINLFLFTIASIVIKLPEMDKFEALTSGFLLKKNINNTTLVIDGTLNEI